MFNDIDIVGIRVLVNGERVDVADLGFICDGDELLLVRESDILLESSGTTNNDELGISDVNSVPSGCLEPLEIGHEDVSSPVSSHKRTITPVFEAIPSQISSSEWITLNVGGTRFVTCRSTIEMKVQNYQIHSMMHFEKFAKHPKYNDDFDPCANC